MRFRMWPFGFGGDSRKTGYQFSTPVSGKATAAPVTFDSAMSVSAFWASARLLTESVSSMPIKCYNVQPDSNIKALNTNYELWRLLNYKPNRYQTRTEFFEQIMLNLVTWGNSYVVIQKSASGRIISLLPLVSSQMEVKLLEDGTTLYEYTTANNNVKVYASETIWHVKLFGNGLVGLSPLGYARNTLGISIALEERMTALTRNGGKATGILTIDEVLKEPQREAIRKNFKGLTEGNNDQLFVLEAGMKYQQVSLSPSDMQLIENRRFSVEDIARFMGVPSVLINDTSATTTWGSGISEINMGFYKLNLKPYLERIESSMKRWLMPESDWENIEIEFDFDSLLRADKATRIEAQTKAVNAGLLSPNEGRAEEGREPKTGGDDIYLNGSLVPAGTQSRQTQEVPNNGS